MRPTVIKFLLLGSMLVAACGRDPCEVDGFFCAAPDEWESRAAGLRSERVLELHILAMELYHPSPDTFAKVLGSRGEPALVVLIDYLGRHPEKRDDLIYVPILYRVIEARFDFCRSRYRNQLTSLVAEDEAQVARLQEICSSELGRVPSQPGSK